MKNLTRSAIRPVILTLVAPVAGFVLIFLLELLLKIDLSKLLKAIVNLAVVAPIAFVLFPRQLGIPFGKIETRAFLQGIGLYFPDGAWKHIALGLILAGCTLSGMLIPSILTGKYAMDTSTINLPHLVFSLNPGLWEELFYRGVLMILLLKLTRSLKWALAIQVALFALFHIKGTDIWAFVDVISVTVMAVGFTYAAYKTRALIAGIVFHYFHDAFLLFVQLGKDIDSSVADKAMFHGTLWVMVGVGCAITKLAVDRFGVRAPTELYHLARPVAETT